MKTTSKLLVCALLATSLSACATRKGPPSGGGDRGRPPASGFEGLVARPVSLLFAGMDSNSNYTVTRAELAAGTATEWARMTSSDRVTATKLQDWSLSALGSREAQPTLLAFDRNFDISVSRDEFEQRLITEFATLDKNKDGQLERAEMLVLITQPKRQERGGGQERGQRGGGGPPPR